MNRFSTAIFKLFLLSTFLFIVTSCSPAALTDLDSQASHLPRVALAPVKLRCKNPTPWDLGHEVDLSLEKSLVSLGNLKISSSGFLRAHQRLPAATLWHSAELGPAKLLLPHDFVVLVEISQYNLIKEEAEGLDKAALGLRNIKPFYYDIQAYIRIIDLTGRQPRLALQEQISFQLPISLGQVQTDQTLKDWRDPHYYGGAHASVTGKLTKLLSKAIEERVQQAWQRRLPLSRYPKALHSKL